MSLRRYPQRGSMPPEDFGPAGVVLRRLAMFVGIVIDRQPASLSESVSESAIGDAASGDSGLIRLRSLVRRQAGFMHFAHEHGYELLALTGRPWAESAATMFSR